MNEDTFIGFCWHEVKAYCKRCEKSFKYGYNSAGRGFDSGNDTCPICHKRDMIETNDHIDTHIDVLKSFIRIATDDGAKKIRKEINELLKIQRIWLAEEEKE